ncbi:MAG: hypothetical protein IJ083_04750 [Clostridia bacterium]|nr:hypothetical protein [Clostridia bacterium]
MIFNQDPFRIFVKISNILAESSGARKWDADKIGPSAALNMFRGEQHEILDSLATVGYNWGIEVHAHTTEVPGHAFELFL